MNLVVNSLVNAPEQQVNFPAVFWKVGGYFLSPNKVCFVRKSLASLDRVVVGEGNELHASPFEFLIDELWFRGARWKIQFSQNPIGSFSAEFGVYVKVSLAGWHWERHGLGWSSSHF